jgi:chitinase
MASNTKRVYTPTGKRSIYYHTNWAGYNRNFQVKDIPDYVTDIAYAFYNLDSNGNLISGDTWADTDKRYIGTDSVIPPDTWNNNNGFYGNFGQFKKLIDSGRKLNIQLAIGGWTWSKYFSDSVSTENTRTNFVNNIITLFKKYPIFNGVSLDWEYLSNDGVNYGKTGNIVRKQDFDNFILFLTKLRNELNTNNMSHYNIAFCCIAATDKAKFPVDKLVPLIDEFHVMTYDFHDGAWGETITAHHTNPRKSSHGKWSCEEAADYYISKGVPSIKLYIGGAFYSRGFSNSDGLGKKASGASSDTSWDSGIVDYKDLPKSGAIEYLDPESKAAYSYDPVKKVFNSYDNSESMIEKCKIIYEKNLAGIIIWENSGDDSNKRTLSKVLKDNLTHGRPTQALTPVVPTNSVVTPSIPAPIQLPIAVPIGSVTSTCICNKLKGLHVSFDINFKDGNVENIDISNIKSQQ